MIARLDIIGELIESLRRDELTREQLLSYTKDNAHILKSNAEQALMQYKVETIDEAVDVNLPRYVADKEHILANYAAFARAADQVTDQVARIYEHDLPEIVLVPCIGLYTNGGWRQQVEERSYVCVALELERLATDVHLDILLAHEVAHGIAETKWDTVLDGFYGKGHATCISSALCPGHPEEAYFHTDRAWLDSCKDWIEANRERIRRDAPPPLQVLDPHHKFYFTTGLNPDYPNIGYLIGALYLEDLHTEHTLQELRTYARTDEPNQATFAAFISGWAREGYAGG
jgi:hypothetical protein